jgi:glyoxylase-like metal-dependent hydrolase (beta-lactamase superfamily II)
MLETFRFTLGTFSCMAIQDDARRYPTAMFLTNLAKDAYEPVLSESGQSSDEVELPYTCLFIDTGRHRVLVDTGMGAPSGKLLALLRTHGIEPGAIDTVVLSHGHPDHVGGCLAEAGKPAFFNARYVMLRKEWDYWMSNPNLAELPVPPEFKHDMLATTLRNLSGVRSQLDLINPETEIVEGINAIAAFGHTPGHMALEISSADRQLLFAADAVVLPLHLQFPETIGVTDHVPSEVVATRLMLLEKAAQQRSLISTSHFPFPGLGYAIESGTRWRWRPVEAVKSAA